MFNIKNKKIRGFTLVELLIVMGITVVLSGIGLSSYFGYQSSVVFDGSVSELFGTLRDTQQRAISQENSSAWGVYINAVADGNDYYEVFYGDSYAAGIVMSRTTLSSSVQFSAPAQGQTVEIIFAKSTGLPNSAPNITIISKRNSSLSKTIAFNVSTGMIGLWTCGDMITDPRDGNIYGTVLIGSQCWMAQNMDYDNGCSAETWVNYTDVGWCGYYIGGPFTNEGLLYQWSAAMNDKASCNGTGGSPNDACAVPVQGICPVGWHVPSYYEWTTLERAVCTSGTCATDFTYDLDAGGFRGTDEGSKLAGSAALWNDGVLDAHVNFGISGFGLLPAGFHHSDGAFRNRSVDAYVWSSFETGDDASGRHINIDDTGVERWASTGKAFGFSVRCLKN